MLPEDCLTEMKVKERENQTYNLFNSVEPEAVIVCENYSTPGEATESNSL